MARAAMALGHEYLVVTDHSPRLTVAHGLSPERLAAQLDEIAEVNARLAPFRILTGMEVDILVDGSLDLPDELLGRLDVVVASVHSKLSMPAPEMTRRMVMAVASPHVDILGHCTGRKVVGTGRAQSRFDADLVFAACAQFDTAVEINCRPERQDPPEELLALALEWNCWISIDTDAHAPGQLEWQPYGCDKAVRCGVDPARIVNTWDADELLSWTAHTPPERRSAVAVDVPVELARRTHQRRRRRTEATEHEVPQAGESSRRVEDHRPCLRAADTAEGLDQRDARPDGRVVPAAHLLDQQQRVAGLQVVDDRHARADVDVLHPCPADQSDTPARPGEPGSARSASSQYEKNRSSNRPTSSRHSRRSSISVPWG